MIDDVGLKLGIDETSAVDTATGRQASENAVTTPSGPGASVSVFSPLALRPHLYVMFRGVYRTNKEATRP
jgi:hypothetical protein